ncbi:MAG: hypothetical protein ACXABY_06430 [Candidatus Thorarchaeota archaeon]
MDPKLKYLIWLHDSYEYKIRSKGYRDFIELLTAVNMFISIYQRKPDVIYDGDEEDKLLVEIWEHMWCDDFMPGASKYAQIYNKQSWPDSSTGRASD